MKKNGILTFLFAFVPGAGQMYQGSVSYTHLAVSFESTEGPCRAPPSTAGKEDEQVVDNTGIQRDGATISVSGLHLSLIHI